MPAFKRDLRAVPMVGLVDDPPPCPHGEAETVREGGVDLWADSVGEAAAQLGLVLSLAFALKVLALLLNMRIL
ncbi:MAG: hypothetical protein ABSB49_06935 [Polyangia bacterium]